MSTRLRAAPWFGTKGERATWPCRDPLDRLGVEVSRPVGTSCWRAPSTWAFVTWAPGQRERAAAMGYYLSEPEVLEPRSA